MNLVSWGLLCSNDLLELFWEEIPVIILFLKYKEGEKSSQVTC